MKVQIDLKAMIYLSLGFSLSLILARVVYSGSLHYVFISWNLFLAWVPYRLSILLNEKKDSAGVFQTALLFCWLIFFPNAPYVITDFLHLGESPKVPLWFDVLLLFTASWNGLVLGLISLFYVERFMEYKFNRRIATYGIVAFVFLSGFGVYAGRYLRWNSWYVFTRPGSIIEGTADRLFNPQDHPATWGVTFLFGAMLLIMYFTIKKIRFITR